MSTRRLYKLLHTGFHKKPELENKCQSTGKWLNELYSHTRLSTLRKKELLVHGTTWMSFKNILSERCQLQKNIFYTIPLIRNSRTDKTYP